MEAEKNPQENCVNENVEAMNKSKTSSETGASQNECENCANETCETVESQNENECESSTPQDESASESELEKLQKENAELKDQLLRRAADFDNYRKRMLKEKQDTFDFANENLLRDLLDSLDNFDRTLVAAKDAQDAKSIAEGVAMINASLVKLLEEKYNLLSFGKIGDEFNPDEHEAIASEVGSVAEPILKEVYLKGYKLKDKVIRHAKVMVTMPSETK